MLAVHGYFGDNEEKRATVFEKKRACTAGVLLDVQYVVACSRQRCAIAPRIRQRVLTPIVSMFFRLLLVSPLHKHRCYLLPSPADLFQLYCCSLPINMCSERKVTKECFFRPLSIAWSQKKYMLRISAGSTKIKLCDSPIMAIFLALPPNTAQMYINVIRR